MTNKIIKRKCYDHPEKNRDISEYYFWLTDYKGRDIYECKKCKDDLDKALDREERIREHNKIQEEKSWELCQLKMKKRQEKREKSIKENIWDFVVKKDLAKGLKLKGNLRYLFLESIPKEVLQLRRATMKLERAIKDRTPSTNKKEVEPKKIPLKICNKHGELFLLDLIKSGKNPLTGEQNYKCRKCMSDLHKDYYERKKDFVLSQQKIYKLKNPEKVKETKLKSWRKCNGKD